MNEVLNIHTILYPPSPTTFPTVWRPHLREMLPPRFAVWYPEKTDYQVFDIQRMANYSVIIKPIRPERENPFYFAIENAGDRQSRTITIYKPRAFKHSHVDVAIWFTGAWLCKRSTGRLHATIPIMGVSDHTPFPLRGNVGIYQNHVFMNWCINYTHNYVREMTHNRKIYTSIHPFQEHESVPISEIPKFVATALVKDAIEKGDVVCPITLESITHDNAAVTSCFHIFEKKCIQTWLQEKSSCPVCKQTCKVTYV